ncbi:MAG: MinD/ParA family protein [Planctomycetota bacterium]|nr:MAG: MinD/ParA family protein [Planctomycetota bacterium]
MPDQAEKLRKKALQQTSYQAYTIALASPKGGVGRTSICANLALTLHNANQKVCAIDFSFHLGDLALIFQENPPQPLENLLKKNLNIWDILHTTKFKLSLLASSYRNNLSLTPSTTQSILQKIEPLKKHFDFILIDTRACLENYLLPLYRWCDEVMLLTTAQPSAIVGCYAFLKSFPTLPITLLLNSCESKRQEREITDLICQASRELLGKNISNHSPIPQDHRVQEALFHRAPFVSEFPNTKATKAMQVIASELIENKRKFLNNLSPIFYPYKESAQ